MDFLLHLFDTSGFPARWHCGAGWTEHSWLGWLHIFSDIGVFSAYFAIPGILLYFLQRKKDLPFRSIFLLFGAFILCCGSTHIIEAIIFWWPIYPFAGLMKFVTAVVSWATVIALVRVAPQALAMRSPEELEREIAARKQAEESLLRANNDLERRVQERTADLVRANEALHQEREWFRTTLHSIGDGVIATDASGRVQLINSIAQTLTGWTESDAKGKTLEEVFNIVHEETRNPVPNPANEALKEGKIVALANHTVLIAKDGTERPINDSAAPIRNVSGEISGAVLVFRDEGERRQRLTELLNSEQRLSFALDAAELGQWELSLPDLVAKRTLRHDQIFGYDTLLPHWTYDLFLSHVVPEQRASVNERFKNAMNTEGSWELEFRIKRLDGAIRWVWIKARLFRDAAGNVQRILGTVSDVTERKQRDETLTRNRERLELVVNSSEIGLWYCDLPFSKLEWNRKCKELFGLPPDCDVTIDVFFEALHPDDRERTRKTIEHSLATRGDYDIEYRTVSKEGQLRWVRAIGRTFCDVLGVPVRFDGITVEVTERKRSEEALLEADRMKDKFLATLAHELRNPLAPLRNGLQILRLAGDRNPAAGKAREMMERQLLNLVRLVDDLLDVSRISTGKVDLRKEHVELASVVNNAVEASRPFIDEQEQKLEIALPEQPIALNVDPIRLSQVFQNLLNNAAKYSEKGAHIRLSAEKPGNEVVIRISDTGLGIDPENLPRIFEMFSQVNTSLEKSHGGLGIGLSLAKGLVELHGGRIEASSGGPGKGSEFRIYLPVLDQPIAPKPHASVGRSEKPALKRRILVVDDNADAAESLSIMLEMQGNETKIAHDAKSALACAPEFQPDVVLSDIGLPGINGYELARTIRTQPWGKNVVLIAVTGWGQDEDRQRSREAGFDHHMVKPVDTDVLSEMLSKMEFPRGA